MQYVNRKYLIYVDTNPDAGFGHFFRSLALGLAIKQLELDAKFYLTHHSKFLKKVLSRRGLELCENFNGLSFDVIIFDGYTIIKKPLTLLKKNKNTITVKYVDMQSFEADWTLPAISKQNLFKYALTLPDYVTKKTLNNSNKVHKIMINFGGRDEKNMTLSVLQMIDEISSLKNILFSVVLAESQCGYHNTVSFLQNCALKVRVIKNSSNLAFESSQHQIIIGAAGVSLIERIALNIPSITFLTAQNQEMQWHIALENDATFNGGIASNFDKKKFISQLLSLCENHSTRDAMSKACEKLYDGLGAVRVVKLLAQVQVRRDCFEAT